MKHKENCSIHCNHRIMGDESGCPFIHRCNCMTTPTEEWKEELIKLGNKSETYGMVSIHDVYDLMSQTLSSQAHALKEQMKVWIKENEYTSDDLAGDKAVSVYDLLSAIESIEI